MDRQMTVQTHQDTTHEATFQMSAPNLTRVALLTNQETEEVLAFLKVRPIHTVVMTSFINDNGIESELNRGNISAIAMLQTNSKISPERPLSANCRVQKGG